MQASHWTPDLIIPLLIAACLGAAFAALVSALVWSRKTARLTAQREQAQQDCANARNGESALQAQLRQVEGQNHQQQLEHSRLTEQLSAARQDLERLEAARNDDRQQRDELNRQLSETTTQRHQVERQLESAQADRRALQAQVDELRERLKGERDRVETAQADINRLKDELSAAGQRNRALETSEKETRERLTEAQDSLRIRQSAYEQLQAEHQAQGNQYTELKTTLERREEHFREQMAQLSDTRQSLTKEFENLANKIFEEKGKTFTHTSQASIDSMLKPFREQIEGFQKRINEVHDTSVRDASQLNAEIRKVLEIGLQMSKEANNLTSALKGDSQQRGAWGEAQLRRTLEMSGLIEEAHFEAQTAFRDADGRHRQTDYLIKLPDGKHIIIDSKVSLVAYDRAVSADSPEEYHLAMEEHTKAVRRHIDDLASKDYTNLVGMRSPGFVLMFMPIEPAYIEALKNNRDLFEYGYKKGIVLVSHTTLIPILRTVSNLWMIERSNAEAREISERAGDIYNQVCVVAERLSKLGGTLATVSNHYNSTVTALAGKQGLYGKVERFSQLSAKVSKSLPSLEPAHMDFESERLVLIVESVEEPEEQEEPDEGEDREEPGEQQRQEGREGQEGQEKLDAAPL